MQALCRRDSFLRSVCVRSSDAARSAPPDLTAPAEALASFEMELAALRRDGITRALPEEAVQRLFGLAFGFEQIGRNLGELAGRVADWAPRR